MGLPTETQISSNRIDHSPQQAKAQTGCKTLNIELTHFTRITLHFHNTSSLSCNNHSNLLIGPRYVTSHDFAVSSQNALSKTQNQIPCFFLNTIPKIIRTPMDPVSADR